MTQLSLHNIAKNFGDFVASKDISFSAKKGELITLLGPSGCGKTTLLKMIGGFHHPDSGEIKIGETVVNNVPPEKRNTSMCFQSYALFPHLSVHHNVAFGLQQKKIAKDEIIRRVDEAIEQVSLQEHAHKMPSELSGGQQQRVALARAMVTRPDVILFDEPLSNLDAKLRESVRFEIRALQKKYGLTAVYVTHDQAEALAMSDKIVVLNRGSIEQIGTPDDIYYTPINSFVADFIGSANIFSAYATPTGKINEYALESVMGSMTVTSDEAPVADNIKVCWRPEDAIILDDNADIQQIENKITLNIKNMAFMGNVTDIIATIPGDDSGLEIRLQTPKKPKFSGEQLSISLPANCIRFLEEAN